jgi:hypothetical protein
VTSPAADDPLDPHVSAAMLHEARSRLLRAARAAQRAWLVALGGAVALASAAAGLFAVSLFVGPGYVVMWTVLLSAAIYNVTRFWPQPPQPPGVDLDAEEVRRLRHALDPHAPDWPRDVTLVPDPVVRVSGHHLTLGMPILACLAPRDLRRLVAIGGRSSASAEDDGVIRRALTLVDSDLGRRVHLWRRNGRAARGLTRQIQLTLAEFAAEHQRWLAAFRNNAEASSIPDSLALHHQDLVVEGWQLLRKEWLDPSLERGCWHPAPFSSLREFLAGVQAVGALDGALPARPTDGPVVDLVAAHETDVADVLLGDRRADELRDISWSEHPSMVTIPLWRAMVGEALEVNLQLTGVATPATLEGVLGLIESGDLIPVAQQVAPDHGFDPERTDWASMSRWVGGYPELLLTAVVGMAAIDSGRFRARWSWPEGTSLANDEGWVLPLHPIANEVLRPPDGRGGPAFLELRTALGELGIDVTGTLWLTREHGDTSPAERPTGSFVAFQGLSSRQVIVTDRALHVFGRPWSAGLRNHYAMRMRGADELRTRMLRVWQGDETDQTAYLLGADVVRAKFSVLTGGGRWRLAMHGRHEKLTLRGLGDGRVQEEQVAALLGDRLTTTWLHSPGELVAVRNAIGRVGMALGGLALAAAVVLSLLDPTSWSRWSAPYLAVGGVLALVVAVLPDLVMEVVWKVRGPDERPEPRVETRRYARTEVRSSLRLGGLDASSSRESAQSFGSAMESMTLDLGDLPELADWPDEVIDLDDLPDWPPEMTSQR